MKKIYITDLDHTFLRSDLSLSNFTKQVWNAKAEDALLSIATARSFYSATKLLQGFTINAPMILLDGALIVSPEKEVIAAHYMNEELSNAMIQEGIKFANLHPFVIGLKEGELDESFDFPLQQTAVQQKLLENFKKDARLQQFKDIIAREKTFKIVYMGSYEQMHPLNEHLKKHFGQYFEFKLSPENYSQGYFLTILSPQGDKAHGLQTISEYINLDMQDFTVFGDSVNDIGMFKRAGMSIAVSNALNETKKHAKIISEHSNDEDAVAKYLNQH